MIEQRWCKGLALGVLAASLGCGRAEPSEGERVEATRAALLAAACAIDPTGNLSLTVADGETAVLARRVSDDKVVANATTGDAQCAVLPTARITITGDGGDNKVILDFGNGLFGAGTAAGANLVVDLGGETVGDSVKLRGTPGADSYTLGDLGADLDGDMRPDLTLSGVEDLVVSTGVGDDVVSGRGGDGTGAPLPIDLSVYCGAGDDQVIEADTAVDCER